MKNSLVDNFSEIFTQYPNFGDETVAQHIEKLKELDEYFPPSLSFLLVANTSMLTYEFVSRNIQHATGHLPSVMLEKGMNYFFAQYHPQDMEVWVVLLNDLMKFTMSEVPLADRPKLSYTWNFRVKHANGTYFNMFTHQLPLYFDDDGKPIIGVAQCTVVGDGEFMPIRGAVKLLNASGEYETLYTKNYSQELLSGGLSNRELDIVRLLALNNTSKSISEKLSISIHTVNTHRRNINKKLGIDSTRHLVNYCMEHQLF